MTDYPNDGYIDLRHLAIIDTFRPYAQKEGWGPALAVIGAWYGDDVAEDIRPWIMDEARAMKRDD